MLSDLLFRFRSLFQRNAVEAELDDELRFHAERQVEKHVLSGLTQREARRRVRLEEGGLDQIKEECRRASGIYFIEILSQDVRFGLRMLRESPGFTAVAVLTLALGIGANTAMFSIVDTVLLRPLPFPNSDRIVWAWGSVGAISQGGVSPPDFVDYREQNHSFEHFGAFSSADPENLAIRGQAEQVQGAMVSSEFFEVLGAAPLLGRTFLPTDEQVTSPDTVALGYGLWRTKFGADPNVIGQTVNLNGAKATIVAVMRDGFGYPPQAELWFPTPMLNSNMQLRPTHSLRPVGLLKRGVNFTTAQADVDEIAGRLAEQYPSSNKGWRLRLEPMQDATVGRFRAPLLLLVGAVSLVLLIACVNVANLSLARNGTRSREFATRLAMGASRGRIIGQLLTESTLLSLLGGGTGILLADWGLRAVRSLGPSSVPRLADARLDISVLVFTIILSVFVGVIFGLAPALHTGRAHVQDSLSEGRYSSSNQSRRRLGTTLVVCEVMLSIALLVGAALLLDSFWRLVHQNPGFNSERVLTAQLVLPSSRYADETKRAEFVRDFFDKLRALPGVEYVGGTSGLPLNDQLNDTYFTTGTTPPPRLQDAEDADFRLVTGDYFQAMQMPLLAGRVFSKSENESSTEHAVIVDEPLASKYFRESGAVGKHLLGWKPGGFASFEIVGVVGGARFFSLQMPSRPTIYLSYAQIPGFNLNLVVHSATDHPEQLASGIRAALASVDPYESLSSFREMQKVVSTSAADSRFGALLLGFFGVVALGLAAAGIFGVVAYNVAQATHEIGIRLALGGAPSDILRLIMARGMKPVLIGTILGLALAMGTTRLLASQLYDVRPGDPAVFLGAAATLGFVASLACYLPARRATKVDPMVALRHE